MALTRADSLLHCLDSLTRPAWGHLWLGIFATCTLSEVQKLQSSENGEGNGQIRRHHFWEPSAGSTSAGRTQVAGPIWVFPLECGVFLLEERDIEISPMTTQLVTFLLFTDFYYSDQSFLLSNLVTIVQLSLLSLFTLKAVGFLCVLGRGGDHLKICSLIVFSLQF